MISTTLPSQSIVRIGDSLYVASPALCLAQMAHRLTESQLAFMATSLCSIYAISNPRSHTRGQSEERPCNEPLPRRSPVTNRHNLLAYLENASSIRGSRSAKRAVFAAAERSRSPMESEAFLLFTLPPRLGGYHLSRPLLNHPVALPGGERLEADLCWPDHRIVVEYFGEDDHTKPDSMRRDARRANAYAEAHYTMLTTTNEHRHSAAPLSSLAESLFAAVGRRMRMPKDFPSKQAELFQQLNAARTMLSH